MRHCRSYPIAISGVTCQFAPLTYMWGEEKKSNLQGIRFDEKHIGNLSKHVQAEIYLISKLSPEKPTTSIPAVQTV